MTTRLEIYLAHQSVLALGWLLRHIAQSYKAFIFVVSSQKWPNIFLVLNAIVGTCGAAAQAPRTATKMDRKGHVRPSEPQFTCIRG